jgi:hypothetical protein
MMARPQTLAVTRLHPCERLLLGNYQETTRKLPLSHTVASPSGRLSPSLISLASLVPSLLHTSTHTQSHVSAHRSHQMAVAPQNPPGTFREEPGCGGGRWWGGGA